MSERDPGATTLPRSRHGGGRGAEEPWGVYVRLVYAEALAPHAPEVDQVFPLTPQAGRELVLGRQPDDAHPRTLALPYDSWASRRHARFVHLSSGSDEGVVVTDLGSRNGTYVDGQRLGGPVVARPGQVVRVGSTLFVVGIAPLQRRATIVNQTPPPEGLHARAWPMLELWERMMRVAATDLGVLFVGEMGTGKTRLARQLHLASPRREGPFVSINASAIPQNLEEATLFGVVGGFIPTVKRREGLIAAAAGGTLFIDELADMPALAQAKLLDAFDPSDPSYLPVGSNQRVPTRCRLISATNRPVFDLARQGVVRQDLLSRLVATQLQVPPLRLRREDLLPLFWDAVKRFGGAPAAAIPEVDVAEALLLAPWVENVRGLELLAGRAAAGEPLTAAVVQAHASRGGARPAPAPIPPSDDTPARPPAALPVAEPPKEAPAGFVWPPRPEELLDLLHRYGWNIKDAAEAVDKRRETLARLVKKRFGAGGKETAQRAFRVWRASGRVPPAEHVAALYTLFFEADEGPEVRTARDAWRTRGEVLRT